MYKRTPDWTISVVEAYRSGETVKAISRRLGPSFGTVQRELIRCDIPFRRVGMGRKPATIVMPTSLAALGYIAGMFDGDGNIYWRRKTYQGTSVRCAIYSTTPAVMEWMHGVMGGRVRWDHKRTERHGWKPIGIWEVNRANDVRAFLSAVRPFLLIKAAVADEALARVTDPFG